MLPPKNKDIYNATIKLFGSEPEPAFEDPGRMERVWERNWGCDNDVGQLRAVLMHRPGDEFKIIDRSKRIEEIGSFGDLEAGWYWQSEDIPELEDLQAQHDALADALRAEGVRYVIVEQELLDEALRPAAALGVAGTPGVRERLRVEARGRTALVLELE